MIVIFFKEELRRFFGCGLVFPHICGVCGKLSREWLCPRCNKLLKMKREDKIISKDNDIEGILEDKCFDELIYIFRYEDIIRKMIIEYKFNNSSYLYKTFVNFLLKNEKIFEKIESYDTIIAVPISRKRIKQRGYNQSLLISKEINKKTGIFLTIDCLYKYRDIKEQSKLNKEQREYNIKNAYKLKNSQIINNKKILLIDDVYTTGSTVNECSFVLMQGKPKNIGVLVLAKD